MARLEKIKRDQQRFLEDSEEEVDLGWAQKGRTDVASAYLMAKEKAEREAREKERAAKEAKERDRALQRSKSLAATPKACVLALSLLFILYSSTTLSF